MIDILMATYNGEKYIEQQIESILKQTYNEWKLYIRDDGSTDSTIEIIEKYAAEYSDKIIIVKDSKKGLGAKLNFAELIKYSTNEYCMFSDQDDVWLENKIELTLNTMSDMEQKFGKLIPILVHTDLKVVNKELDVINASFWNYQNLDPNRKKLNDLLVQNNVTGCTMMINKKLIDLSQDMPKECIMHDWWIALIASTFGKIGAISIPTILYRQHGNNEVGAHKYRSLKFIKNKIYNIKKIKTSINDAIVQSKCFYDMFIKYFNEDQEELINNFYNIKKNNFIKRRLIILKNKLLKQGKVRVIAYLVLV